MNKWLRYLLILGLIVFLVQRPVEAANVVSLGIDLIGQLVNAISAFLSQLSTEF